MNAVSRDAKKRPEAWRLPLQIWSEFRPVLSQEMLALLTGVFLAMSANTAFLREVHATGALHGAGGALAGACLFVLVVALNTLLALLLFSRWSVKPVLAVLLPVSAAAAYYMDHYGVYFDTGMVRNVLQTDLRESSELVSPGLALRVVVAGLLPAVLGWKVVLVRRSAGRAVLIRAGAIMLAVAVAAAAALLAFQSLSALMRNHHEIRHLITPGNYLVSLGRVLADDGAARNVPRKELGIGAHVAAARAGQRPRLLVLVVGETARAHNWGLNGYPRQTTPQLSRLDLVNFPDVASCGTSTEVSLPCMFSAYGREDYAKDKVHNSESLLHVLDRAGIAVAWLDNQGGCKGVCTGLPFQSYEHADDQDFCNAEGCLDGILLKGLSGRIASLQGDAVIVLHQLGNHGPAYSRRYPGAFGKFLPACESSALGDCSRGRVVNAYDNALLYTDDLLARTIRLLGEQPGRDTALFYLSDHGESLGEGGLYLHGMPYAIAPDEQKKVPMLMWFSSGYAGSLALDVSCMKRKAAVAGASHDNYFHTVLGLMQVSAPEYRPGLDLLDGCRAGRGG
ncbi:phosphoethanolamine transferase [Pseudoxanthomonas broegbernensis]|uniref:Phosphoethanolamine transferase n=1 Tax=Pseudoxanthomonas broegbernensis TaxID=83619 RepID=A0A7V8GN93_9GAMM|nr:phosphoethanolamine--lipid A transferase [Pseudoxanthomonas broegbernensis]KAF1686941.1 phosphoethanolamine transferase [Pseudoxanthomonas broegbernensis]MBB6065456.1 lipid A ethanolaminephosphotransferase [Pseudoxanthomonas broegbernensis]